MSRYFLTFLYIAMLLGLSSAQDKPSESVRFCFVGADDLADPSAPRFEQYPAAIVPPFSPAKLDLRSSPIANMYRTVIRQQMKQGPNFAGHYRVAIWGCGSSCAQFAVVDLQSGRVITAKGVNNVSDVHFGANDFLPGTDSEEWGFRLKKDSRLLVLVGTLNEDESKEGAFYYVLKDGRLQPIHKTLAKRNTCTDEKD